MGIPEIPLFVYTLMLWGGVIGLIVWATFVYVPPPWIYMVEINLPFCSTIKVPVKSGLKFIPKMPPLVLIKSRLFMADDTIVLTIGSADGRPGGAGRVELLDTSAGVVAQIILRVTDPDKATYNIDDIGQSIPGMQGYKVASINKVEGKLRMLLAGKDLKEAMEMVGRKATSGMSTELDVLKIEANDEMKNWGVALIDATILDFDLDASVVAQRDKIIAARKQADALAIEAKGKKEAAITIAEGDRRARELAGLGQREQIEGIMSIGGGIDPNLAMRFHLGEQVAEAMRTATLIVTPGADGGLNIPGAIATAGAILNPKGKQATSPPANQAGTGGQGNGDTP